MQDILEMNPIHFSDMFLKYMSLHEIAFHIAMFAKLIIQLQESYKN